MEYFDIHSHLNFDDYDKDLEDVISRLKDTNTGTIVVGTDYSSSKRAVELAEENENIWACIGVHPTDDPSIQFNPSPNPSLYQGEGQGWGKLVKHPKVVAVGECGLDFFRVDREKDFERQKKLFLDQIEFALEHDLPIMIHTRNTYEDILNILKPLKERYGERLRGNAHFFAGDIATAEQFLGIGFTLSFTGVITFTHDYDEVIRFAPLDMIHAETDAPFVAPVPHRGKRNEPSYVQEVVKRIAEIRGDDFEVVRETLISNTKRVFKV